MLILGQWRSRAGGTEKVTFFTYVWLSTIAEEGGGGKDFEACTATYGTSTTSRGEKKKKKSHEIIGLNPLMASTEKEKGKNVGPGYGTTKVDDQETVLAGEKKRRRQTLTLFPL